MTAGLVIWTKANRGVLQQGITPLLRSAGVPVRFAPIRDGLPPLSEGEVLLALGAAALSVLQEENLLPKNRKIGSLRKTHHVIGEHYVFVSYDPAIIFADSSKTVDLQIDVRRALRTATRGMPYPEIGEYRYVQDYESAIKFIREQYSATNKAVPVSLDLETVGLDPYDPEKFIVSISITYKWGESEVIVFDKDTQPEKGDSLWEQIHWLCTSDKVALRGANLKYDMGWLAVKWGIYIQNLKFDTLLVGSLLDENRSNSLETHAYLYTDMGGYDSEFNAKYDKSRMDLVAKNHPEDFLIYAGGDTDAAYRVAEAEKKILLQDKKLTRFYVKLLRPASIGFAAMEQTGVLIDRGYFEELQQRLEQDLQDLTERAYTLLPPRLKLKYKNGFKLTKSAIIKDYLFSPRGLGLTPVKFTEKTKEPATDWDHLSRFMDNEEARPFLETLRNYNVTAKTLSTYVTGFLKHLRSDGRFHATAVMWHGGYGSGDAGTITGRLSFRDPALQTLPKHTALSKDLRRGYIPPPGYAIVNWDYSQGELRITAVIANVRKMKEAYLNGIDLHLATGAQLRGLSVEDVLALKETDKEQYAFIRQSAKAGNFGLIYGMQASGYQIYAQGYGVYLSSEEAEKERNAFFELYPELLSWHTRSVQIARRDLAIRSPLGRLRRVPLIRSKQWSVASKAERQAINAQVQSTLSDMSLLALAEFHKRYGYPEECQFCMMTHDSLTAYVKADKVDFWGPLVQQLMETLPLHEFDWYPDIPFTVDWEVGYDNFGDMVSMTE